MNSKAFFIPFSLTTFTRQIPPYNLFVNMEIQYNSIIAPFKKRIETLNRKIKGDNIFLYPL